MRKLLLIALVIMSAVALIQGGWIHAKAMLAQYLIAESWAEQRLGRARAKPWPWADTWPVARLQVPELGIDQFVLAGANGRVLAFGPGHINGTAMPASGGNTVISGHRDTHFRWLKNLKNGSHITLTMPDGRQVSYVVKNRQVISMQDTWALEERGIHLLRLLTCYPFGAVMPGGSRRYLVTAEVEQPEITF